MYTQNQRKLLLIIIGILLVGNIVLLCFFISNQSAEKKGMRANRQAVITAFLKNDAGFTAQQLLQYDSLYAQHHAKLKLMFEKIKDDKAVELKGLSSNNYSDSAIAAAASVAASRQKNIEVIMFKHYRDIRNLCTPQQQPVFDSLFYKVLNRNYGAIKK